MQDILTSAQSRALEGMAAGLPALDLLREYCLQLQGQFDDCAVGVSYLDRACKNFAGGMFPTLAPSFGEGLQGIAVADTPGSCARAVFDRETVDCGDVSTDSRFNEVWVAHCLAHGVEAVLSVPATSRGEALGTLVIGYPKGRELSSALYAFAHEASDLCGTLLRYRLSQMKSELLVGELQHRTRNLMATIGAIAYATLRRNPDPSSFRAVFDARLAALSRAHSLALEPTHTDLQQLFREALAPYSIECEVALDGPKFLLFPDSTVAISLAAHELATNAAKYGAFSRAGGQVNVNWSIQRNGDEDVLELTWREKGGPAVRPPEKEGYGNTTIRRGLSVAIDAQIEMEYPREGFICRLTAPVSSKLGMWVN